MAQHRQLIADKFGRIAGNGHRLLEYLFEHPIVMVNNIKELTGTSYAAANNLVDQFVKHGILKEYSGLKRNRRFVYQDYIGLFQDEL